MLSTAPGEARTHWEQLYFPLLVPLEVKTGETVSVTLRSRTTQQGGTHIAWSATRLDARGRSLERHGHDLDKGFLP